MINSKELKLVRAQSRFFSYVFPGFIPAITMLRSDLLLTKEDTAYLGIFNKSLEIANIFKLHEYLLEFDTLSQSKKGAIYTSSKNNRFIFHPLFILDAFEKVPLIVVVLNNELSLNTNKTTVLVNRDIIKTNNKVYTYIRKTYLKYLKLIGYTIEYVNMLEHIENLFNSYKGINTFDRLLPIGFDDDDFFTTILKTRKKLVIDSLILNSILLKMDVTSYDIFDILDYNTISKRFYFFDVDRNAILSEFSLEETLELYLPNTAYIVPYSVPNSSLRCMLVTEKPPEVEYCKGTINSSIQLDKNFIIIY